MDYTLFVFLAPAAAGVVALNAAALWPYRRKRVTRVLWLYLTSVATLLVANTLELLVEQEMLTVWLARISHSIFHLLVLSWLAFAFVHSGREHLATGHRLWPYLVMPALSTVIIFADPWLGLFYRSIDFFRAEGFLTMTASYGPWFWVNGIYLYLVLFAGATIVVQASIDRSRFYRSQSMLIVAGALLPLLFNVAYVFRVLPWLRKDYTAIAFALSGLLFYVGIQRYGLLSSQAISRSIVIEDLQSAILVINAGGIITDTNSAAIRLFGLRDRVVGKEAVLVTPIADFIENVPLEQRMNFETSLEESGAIRSFDVAVRPITESTGKLVATVITISETTEWVRLQEERDALHFRMFHQERLATIGQIAAGVAHEVNNPLTLLKSAFTSVIRTARALSDAAGEGAPARSAALEERIAEIDEMAQVFNRGFDRILGVLNSLRSNARPVELEVLEPTDLHELIESTLQLCRSAYRQVAMIDKRYGDLPLVDCNPGSINQVLLNIILNAVQALSGRETPMGSGIIRIETQRSGDTVECRILNNGPPIPSDLADEIFEPFVTTRLDSGGTGLGLAIAREIVEKRHHGSLSLVNDPMTGFAIRLPIRRRAAVGGAVPAR